jgi:multicomponent Na+:H+ antiporter subunit G
MTFVSVNILLVLIFIWLTNPTAAHYIAKSEYVSLKLNIKPVKEEV